jgi:DUF1680 family protein
MPVRLNTCLEKVESNVGRIAVTRGPLVYCAEEADNAGPVQRLFVPAAPAAGDVTTAVIAEGPLKGVVKVSFPAKEVAGGGKAADTVIALVPYYAWNNRGEKSMIVWLPRSAGP